MLVFLFKVLKDIGADEVPILTVWNKIDNCPKPEIVEELASTRRDVVCLSASSGEGVDNLLEAIEAVFKVSTWMGTPQGLGSGLIVNMTELHWLSQDAMIPIHICVPFDAGQLVDIVYKNGVVNSLQYTEEGAIIRASVPLFMAATLSPYKIRSEYKYLDP